MNIVYKMVLSLIVAASAISNAEMYLDIRARQCRTYPASEEINQDEYSSYALDFHEDFSALCEIRPYNNECIWKLSCINAKLRLKDINTPAAQRFLSDLDRIPDFRAYCTIIGYK